MDGEREIGADHVLFVGDIFIKNSVSDLIVLNCRKNFKPEKNHFSS